jgi:hypothetical protein
MVLLCRASAIHGANAPKLFMDTENIIDIEAVRLPLWRKVLEQMRADGLEYGKSWPAEFFEKGFRSVRGSSAFAFELMGLRKELEDEDGYYMRSSENGAQFYIVEAEACEEVAQHFETKMKRYARRSLLLRVATLGNEKAKLSEETKAKMDKNAARAGTRLVLLARQDSISEAVRKHAPNLLEK